MAVLVIIVVPAVLGLYPKSVLCIPEGKARLLNNSFLGQYSRRPDPCWWVWDCTLHVHVFGGFPLMFMVQVHVH